MITYCRWLGCFWFYGIIKKPVISWILRDFFGVLITQKKLWVQLFLTKHISLCHIFKVRKLNIVSTKQDPPSCDHHAKCSYRYKYAWSREQTIRTYLNMAVLVCISLCFATLQIYLKRWIISQSNLAAIGISYPWTHQQACNTYLVKFRYSHLSNKRGGWNKCGGWDFLENINP